jgi:hypothetical protein
MKSLAILKIFQGPAFPAAGGAAIAKLVRGGRIGNGGRRGTNFPSAHFSDEAVTRRSTRRLSRIAKGL